MKRPLLLLLALALPASAAPLVQSDAPNDLSKAENVVFVSEGYLASEQEQFFKEARAAAQVVATDPAAAPLRALKPMNFHYVFVPSNAGAAFKAGDPPNDTAIKACVNADGMIQADDAAADTAASAAPDVDVVVILVKFADGAGWQRSNSDVLPGHFGRTRLDHTSSNALIHELGHALAGLGDEYADVDGPPPDDAARSRVALFPNLTLDPTGARWMPVGYQGTPVEGGDRYRHGVWHPTEHCRMNESTSQEFCPVCQAFIAQASAEKPPAPTDLEVANGSITWKGEGAPRAWSLAILGPGDEADFVGWIEPETPTFSIANLPPGDYTAEVMGMNMSGTSSFVYKTFTVPRRTAGIAGAIVGN